MIDSLGKSGDHALDKLNDMLEVTWYILLAIFGVGMGIILIAVVILGIWAAASGDGTVTDDQNALIQTYQLNQIQKSLKK